MVQEVIAQATAIGSASGGRFRRRTRVAALLIVAAMGVSACQTGSGGKETIGGLGGAVLGGVLGSQIGSGSGQLVAVGAGAILGGLLGSSIGRSLDQADRAQMEQTTQTALERQPDRQTSSWVNPNSGNTGTITPRQTYQTSGGSYCREYSQTITVDGRTEQAVGTACRQSDGTWRVVS